MVNFLVINCNKANEAFNLILQKNVVKFTVFVCETKQVILEFKVKRNVY